MEIEARWRFLNEESALSLEVDLNDLPQRKRFLA
jgi:hypothetical protein